MFALYDRLAWRADWVAKYFTVGITAALFFVVMAQVTFNYLLHSGLSWSEELCKLLLAWLTFVGSSLATRRFLHIGLNVFVDRLPSRPCSLVRLAGFGVALAFLYSLTIWGWRLALFGQAQTTNYLNISYFWFYFGIPIGALFNAVQILYLIFLEIDRFLHPERKREKPAGEESFATEI